MFHFGVTQSLGLVSSKLLLVDKNQERECLLLVTQEKMDQNKKRGEENKAMKLECKFT
jgi:hypothetical protein